MPGEINQLALSEVFDFPHSSKGQHFCQAGKAYFFGIHLITESLLRHQREIPIHFYYADGAPMDERQLNAFAFRLQRMPPRVPVSAGLPAETPPEAPGTPWARLLDRILNH